MRRGSGGSAKDFAPDITALRTQIATVEAKLRDVVSGIGAAPSQEVVARLRHDIDGVSARITHTDEGLEVVRKSIPTDTDGMRQLRDRIGKNERDLLELQAELEAEKNKNSALVRRVATLEGSLGRLDALEVLVRALENSVDTLGPRG
jgi:predicted  nucleic acid-binding Zn-ribbon protein